MSEFIEIPASKKSLARRRSLFNIGVNDSDYNTEIKVNGKRLFCPYYRRWSHMLERCYSKRYHDKFPTYTDCTVCDEWLTFSVFRSWMKQQEWVNLELDKDVISIGNKVYGPESCCFISPDLNKLLNDCAGARSEWPRGVTYGKDSKKYRARVNYRKENIHIGYYLTPTQASEAYAKYKAAIILGAAKEQVDARIANGLRSHANILTHTNQL